MGGHRTGGDEGRSDLVRSLWVALTLVPLGLLGWGAFLYAGIRARSKPWLTFAGVYFAATLAGWAITLSDPEDPVDTWREDVGVSIVLFTWIATAVHAFAIRREFLRRTEVLADPRLEHFERRTLQRELAERIARDQPRRALELGVGRPDLPDALHGDLVDVNHAPVEVLAELPDVGAPLAEKIVAARAEIHGFSSLEDLGHLLDLSPHTVERLRGRVVFLPG